MVENTGFIACFLRGTVEKSSYRKLVANLYFVYTAIEKEMQKLKNHPVMGKMYFPELDRKQNLEQDLAYYYGSYWCHEIEPSEATQAYVAQVHAVATTHCMGCNTPFIRYIHCSICAIVFVWIYYLRPCDRPMVLSRRTINFHLVPKTSVPKMLLLTFCAVQSPV